MIPAQGRITWPDAKPEIAGATMKLFSPFPNSYQHKAHRDQWEPSSGKTAVDTMPRLMVSENYCR